MNSDDCCFINSFNSYGELFAGMCLSAELKDAVDNFVERNAFKQLYLNYNWGMDLWAQGFPDILRLELEFRKAVESNTLNINHLLLVAEWGRLRNARGIKCSQNFSFIEGEKHLPGRYDADDIIAIIKKLRQHVSGFGPTYLSKLIRFAFPYTAGAIDTRVVRIFGNGDERFKRHDWIQLKVRNDGYGWYIPENQSGWPREYGKWVSILFHISNRLNQNNTACPHPEKFVQNGLRVNNTWACADVEMALFAYASTNL